MQLWWHRGVEERCHQGMENFLRFLNRKGNDHSFTVSILSYTGEFIILHQHFPENKGRKLVISLTLDIYELQSTTCLFLLKNESVNGKVLYFSL